MSNQLAHEIAQRMNLREQAIAPHYLGLASDLQMLAGTNAAEAVAHFMDVTRDAMCEAYGFSKTEQRKPFAFANGVAIIPVHGTLLNRFGASYGYVTGYNFIRQQHNQAMSDPDVTHIIHDHNSNGGEAAGCFELSNAIFQSRGTKPIVAVVDSNCYSASYSLASAADKVIVTPSAGVGSIGVVATHVSMEKMLEKMGIEITFIHSGDHKVDGNPYQALPADVKANLQKGVDKSRAAFVATVARNRGIAEKIVYDTQARTYRAEDALELGLIDAIAEPAAAMQMILDENSEKTDDSASSTTPTNDAKTTETEQDMSTAEQAKAAAAATAASADAAAVQTAERERVAGILTCEEAKGRSALANHFALKTGMSLEDAKAALAASPAEAAAAPAKVEEKGDKKEVKEGAKVNEFEQAMSKAAHPKVGADGAVAGADQAAEERSPLDALCGDYEMATGQKLVDQK